MLSGLKRLVRNSARGLRHAWQFPLLLPHFTLHDDGVSVLGGPVEPLDARVVRALRLCDGTKTVSQVAGGADVATRCLIEQHDLGRVILWPERAQPVEKLPGRPRILMSPHPDDAALSAYSAVGLESAGANVVNVFTRTAWSRFPDHLRSPEQVQRIREAEEQCFASLASVPLEMMGLPEALLRGYAMDDVFDDGVGGRDDEVRRAIEGRVAHLAAENPDAEWDLPLGVGNHVDHRIVRDSSLDALERAGVRRDRIEFYEDLPYAADINGIPDFSRILPARGMLKVVGERPMMVEWKSELLRVYFSQLTWGQIVKVAEYAKRVGRGRAAERVWGFD